MQRTLAKGLVFAGLVCFVSFLWAGLASAQEGDTVVQGQNGGTQTAAASGPAIAANADVLQAGPTAGGQQAPAQASQIGDNVGSQHSVASAKSGDASAGSQITGVVGSGTVQNQNTSAAAVAVSAPAVAVNVGQTSVGPSATGVGAPAQTSQSGSNRYSGTQIASAHSGDAVAGSQVTGIAGVGDHTVQNSNASFGPLAFSGPVVAINAGTFTAGPQSVGLAAPASTSQVGSNDAVFTQVNDARSGDAVAGGQVTGIVGGGSSTTQNSNVALPPVVAVTGAVVSVNVATGNGAGPSATGLGAPAQASQLGDNAVEIGQSVEAQSGDAVAGGQVTGIVGDQAGHVRVQNQQTSQADIAVSGTVGPVLNVATGIVAGPSALALLAPAQASQTGNNALAFAQVAHVASGDALAGAQVTGVVAGGDATVQNQNTSVLGIAISGPAGTNTIANLAANTGAGPRATALLLPASATQFGSNAASVDQMTDLQSGDAIAGSQVSGVMLDPASATIQNSNASFAAFAFTGAVAPAVGNISTGTVGPQALAIAAPAQSSQTGSNNAAVSQGTELASGDAVSGSQVTGAVVADGGHVRVQNQSFSALTFAVSGIVAPVAGNISTLGAGPNALALANVSSASQLGSNHLVFDQHVSAASGDAVAGGQVTGAVSGGGDIDVQNQNTGIGVLAISGPAAPGTVGNLAIGSQAGPQGLALAAPANASQIGSNSARVSQHVSAESGDAVSGAQVSGLVTGTGDVTVQNSNAAAAAISVSGPAGVGTPFINGLFNFTAGPRALAGGAPASAAQLGSNHVGLAQDTVVESGDAVSGAQVTGTVNGSGNVRIQAQNTSFGTLAFSGPAVAFNLAVGVGAGPSATAAATTAQASQIGSTHLDLVQIADASSGDAVSGAQVIGTAEDDSKIQLQNFAAATLAFTNLAVTSNFATGTVGAQALGGAGTANASHLGNSELAAEQVGEAHTGDATSSAQVSGIIGTTGRDSLHTGSSLESVGTREAGGTFEVSSSASL